MYKYKTNDKKVTCCPLGTYRDKDVVECYYYGIVTLKECGSCKVRSDNSFVKKGD